MGVSVCGVKRGEFVGFVWDGWFGGCLNGLWSNLLNFRWN